MSTQLCQVSSGAGQRLRISWGAGSELHCCSIGIRTRQSDQTETSYSTAVQWECPGHLYRRVIYDAYVKYLELVKQGQPDTGRLDQYCRDLAVILDMASPPALDGDREVDTVAEDKCTWNLLHMFFGMDRADLLISQELAGWLERNAAVLLSSEEGSGLSPESLSQFETQEQPEKSPLYWQTLQRLVSLGWVSDALYLLGLHSHWAAWSSTLVRSGLELSVRRLDAVASLLRCYPRLAPDGLPNDAPGQALRGPQEFLDYQARWQAQCKALLREDTLWAERDAGQEGCRAVVTCMAGDIEGELDAVAGSWMELLVMRLLAKHADIGNQADLLQLLRTCVAAKPPGAGREHKFLSLLVAGCRLDAQAALQACSDGTSWFTAHAADVLAAHAAGAELAKPDLDFYGCAQTEFYRLAAASSLAPHDPTLSVAEGYLAWCPRMGQLALRRLQNKSGRLNPPVPVALREVVSKQDLDSC